MFEHGKYTLESRIYQLVVVEFVVSLALAVSKLDENDEEVEEDEDTEEEEESIDIVTGVNMVTNSS